MMPELTGNPQVTQCAHSIYLSNLLIFYWYIYYPSIYIPTIINKKRVGACPKALGMWAGLNIRFRLCVHRPVMLPGTLLVSSSARRLATPLPLHPLTYHTHKHTHQPHVVDVEQPPCQPHHHRRPHHVHLVHLLQQAAARASPRTPLSVLPSSSVALTSPLAAPSSVLLTPPSPRPRP